MATSARTARSGVPGNRKSRLVEKDGRYHGLVDGQGRVGRPDADDVWRRLHDDAGQSDPKHVGHAGARSRFLKFFPNGFHSDGFSSQERECKPAAKKKLDDNAPLTAALGGGGFGESVLAVFQATNMLSRFEKARVAEMARGRDADAFVQAAAGFTLDGTKATLLELERLLKAHDCAKWTVATCLPFLWRPDRERTVGPRPARSHRHPELHLDCRRLPGRSRRRYPQGMFTGCCRGPHCPGAMSLCLRKPNLDPAVVARLPLLGRVERARRQRAGEFRRSEDEVQLACCRFRQLPAMTTGGDVPAVSRQFLPPGIGLAAVRMLRPDAGRSRDLHPVEHGLAAGGPQFSSGRAAETGRPGRRSRTCRS